MSNINSMLITKSLLMDYNFFPWITEKTIVMKMFIEFFREAGMQIYLSKNAGLNVLINMNLLRQQLNWSKIYTHQLQNWKTNVIYTTVFIELFNQHQINNSKKNA